MPFEGFFMKPSNSRIVPAISSNMVNYYLAANEGMYACQFGNFCNVVKCLELRREDRGADNVSPGPSQEVSRRRGQPRGKKTEDCCRFTSLFL